MRGGKRERKEEREQEQFKTFSSFCKLLQTIKNFQTLYTFSHNWNVLKLFNKPWFCLPLFSFVYLCSNDASMHKFCVCFETPFICNYQHLLLIFPFLTEWFSDNKKCLQNTIYTEFFNKFSSIENYCTFTKPSNAIKLSEYNTWYI